MTSYAITLNHPTSAISRESLFKEQIDSIDIEIYEPVSGTRELVTNVFVSRRKLRVFDEVLHVAFFYSPRRSFADKTKVFIN